MAVCWPYTSIVLSAGAHCTLREFKPCWQPRSLLLTDLERDSLGKLFSPPSVTRWQELCNCNTFISWLERGQIPECTWKVRNDAHSPSPLCPLFPIAVFMYSQSPVGKTNMKRGVKPTQTLEPVLNTNLSTQSHTAGWHVTFFSGRYVCLWYCAFAAWHSCV